MRIKQPLDPRGLGAQQAMVVDGVNVSWGCAGCGKTNKASDLMIKRPDDGEGPETVYLTCRACDHVEPYRVFVTIRETSTSLDARDDDKAGTDPANADDQDDDDRDYAWQRAQMLSNRTFRGLLHVAQSLGQQQRHVLVDLLAGTEDLPMAGVRDDPPRVDETMLRASAALRRVGTALCAPRLFDPQTDMLLTGTSLTGDEYRSQSRPDPLPDDDTDTDGDAYVACEHEVDLLERGFGRWHSLPEAPTMEACAGFLVGYRAALQALSPACNDALKERRAHMLSCRYAAAWFYLQRLRRGDDGSGWFPDDERYSSAGKPEVED